MMSRLFFTLLVVSTTFSCGLPKNDVKYSDQVPFANIAKIEDKGSLLLIIIKLHNLQDTKEQELTDLMYEIHCKDLNSIKPITFQVESTNNFTKTKSLLLAYKKHDFINCVPTNLILKKKEGHKYVIPIK